MSDGCPLPGWNPQLLLGAVVIEGLLVCAALSPFLLATVDPQAGTERERRLRPLFFQRPVFPLYLFILPVSAPEPADWRKVMSPLNFPFAIIILMQSVD